MKKTALLMLLWLICSCTTYAAPVPEAKVPTVPAPTAEQLTHLGNVAGRQQNYREAIADYTKAIQENPHFKKAYYNRAFIYIKLRKYKPAIADLDLAIELDPKYAAAYHVRGIAYFGKSKFAKAVEDYDKAIELDPENIKFHISRLSAYCKMGNSDKAWEEVTTIQKLGGTVNPTIINLLKNRKYRET